MRAGHEHVVRILLENGADRTIKNNEGKDALAIAHEHEKPAVVNLLRTLRSKL
jgi:ankyrin repeat protein